jgi:hypothetical protein
MSDSAGLTVLANAPIEGLADVFDRARDESDERLRELLRETAGSRTVAVPVARGLPEVWHSIVDSLRRRRVRQRLTDIEVPAPWFSFHVPPHGKGQLKVANTSKSGVGLKLTAMGSGWGGGQAVSLTLNRDFQERDGCFAVSIALRTNVTLYEGDVPPRSDVVGIAGIAVSEWRTCPDCCPDSAPGSGMVVPAGEWIDLRRDSKGQRTEMTVELVDDRAANLSVPFKVPGADVEIGIEWSRSSSVTCSTSYLLPGGRRYRPCANHGQPPDLPFWRWE